MVAFELAAALVIGSLLFGAVGDDEIVRLLNTVANLATVMLLVWHQRRVRTELEPKVDDALAVVKRKLGDRDPGCDPNGYTGPERRKDCK